MGRMLSVGEMSGRRKVISPEPSPCCWEVSGPYLCQIPSICLLLEVHFYLPTCSLMGGCLAGVELGAGGQPALRLPVGFTQWRTSGGDLEEGRDGNRSLWGGFQLTSHPPGHLSTQIFLSGCCNCSLLRVIIALRHCTVPGFPLPGHPFVYSPSMKLTLS